MAEADLSKIVGRIMENPKLMEEIKAMVSEKESSAPEENGESAAETAAVSAIDEKSEAISEGTYAPKRDSRRTELLRALRPYLSEERGRAIESMITIADILTVIRES